MSWEWIAPVCTAVVGLAGIAATWLTARAGRTEQREMTRIEHDRQTETALREMRQKSYSAFLASVYNIISTGFFRKPFDPNESINAVNELARSTAEIRIMGSGIVRQMAQHAMTQALAYHAETIKNEEKSDESQAKINEIRDNMNHLLYLLERVMASDLGIPATAPMEESLRHAETLGDAIRAADEAKWAEEHIRGDMQVHVNLSGQKADKSPST